jgi:hypothetical protein
MMSEFLSLLDTQDTFARPSLDSIRQIDRLTQDMKDFPETFAAQVRRTILGRPQSYYGYIRMPYNLTDEEVVDILKYKNKQDVYFAQFSALLKLDFTWYDHMGQHVMVWGESQDIVTTAITAIKMWLKIPAGVA